MRRERVLLVALSWFAVSLGGAYWVWQQPEAAPEAPAAIVVAALGPSTDTHAEAASGARGLTVEEALREVERAAERTTQAESEAQRLQREQLDQARLRRQESEATRDAERKAEIAADFARQAQGAAKRGVSVVMYTTTWCGVCKRARRYFEERAVAFEERDIEAKREWREECRLLNPRLSVPTIRVGDSMMVGFSEASFEQHLARAGGKSAGTR